jgi:hypothetical protein
MKSKRMIWVGHVARIERMRSASNIFVRKGRDSSEDISVDGKTIL